MKTNKERTVHREHQLRMTLDVYYVWVGGSCDYAHKARCSGGAYIMQRNKQ